MSPKPDLPATAFDPWNSLTWDARQHETYEVGYQEGGNNNQADWNLALSEAAPHFDEMSNVYPGIVAAYIQALEAMLREVQQMLPAGGDLSDRLDALLKPIPPGGPGGESTPE